MNNYIKRIVWATNLTLVPSSSQKETGSSKVISHCFKSSLLTIKSSGVTLVGNKYQNILPSPLRSNNQICCLSRILLRKCRNGFTLKMWNIATKNQVMQITIVLIVSSVFQMELIHKKDLLFSAIAPKENFDDLSYFQISCRSRGSYTAEEKAERWVLRKWYARFQG